MFTFDGWVTRVAFELHWALETRLHASALDSELSDFVDEIFFYLLFVFTICPIWTFGRIF